MRTNLPITGHEHPIRDGATLLSATDLDSRIRYANAAFIEASGFSREELLGEPHNLVRHPDMPAAAFADMWATLRSGYAWSALVKNRRRDGDHYWVRANATPIVRDGQLAGYLSVRTKPTRDEVAAAEQQYRRMREGRGAGLVFRRGLLLRTGLAALRSTLRTLPLHWRLRSGLVALWLGAGAAAFGSGLAPAAATPFVLLSGAALVLSDAWLQRQIARPIRQVLQQANRVAAGQAPDGAPMERIDEIGALTRAVQQAGLNLRSLVDDVNLQIHGLQASGQALQASNHALGEHTEQAASHLQEATAALADFSATVRDNATAVRAAAQSAASASACAHSGGELVTEVVHTMGRIAQASTRIGDIIGTIDALAFQTNILALNAAVEAARAGDQGRGFAVVAGEVRTLALRSAEAAQQIRGLIQDSSREVQAGQQQVARAGDGIAAIVAQVSDMAGLLQRIDATTSSQADTITDVHAAIEHLDRTTQHNMLLVDEAARASQDLEHRSEWLAQAAAVFRNTVPASAAPCVPPARAPGYATGIAAA